MVLASRFVYR